MLESLLHSFWRFRPQLSFDLFTLDRFLSSAIFSLNLTWNFMKKVDEFRTISFTAPANLLFPEYVWILHQFTIPTANKNTLKIVYSQ